MICVPGLLVKKSVLYKFAFLEVSNYDIFIFFSLRLIFINFFYYLLLFITWIWQSDLNFNTYFQFWIRFCIFSNQFMVKCFKRYFQHSSKPSIETGCSIFFYILFVKLCLNCIDLRNIIVEYFVFFFFFGSNYFIFQKRYYINVEIIFVKCTFDNF